MPTDRWKLFLFLLVVVISECSGKGPIHRGLGPMDFKRRYSDRIPKLPVEIKGPQTAYYEHKDGARIIKSSHFELDYMLGRKITFFCMATGVPRPEITWFKDGIELFAHKFFQVHEWPIGNDTMKSKMEIDPTTQKDSGFYECQANNQYAVDSRGFRTDYVVYTY